MRPFVPPQKFKKLYWLINSLLMILIALFCVLFFERPEYYTIPVAAFCLFNYFWSCNENWYSLMPRKDKSSHTQGARYVCIILGSMLTVLLLLVHILRFLGHS